MKSEKIIIKTNFSKEELQQFLKELQDFSIKENIKNQMLAAIQDKNSVNDIADACTQVAVNNMKELLKSFYYGEDLNDPEILQFYKDVYESAKSSLEE